LKPAASVDPTAAPGWGFALPRKNRRRPDDVALVVAQSGQTDVRTVARPSSIMPRKRSAQTAQVKRRILIVDNHPLVRRGLRALIDAEPDLTVCAEAASPEDGLGAIAETRPDLVIADLSLGPGDGLELVKAIRSRHANLRVLLLTMHDMPRQVRRAFAAGASGHVSKQEKTETLLMAMRSVLRGETYGAPAG
jgi:CheY-like chemotaxis protein